MIKTVLASLSALVIVMAVGCAAPTVEEEEGETASNLGAGAVESGIDKACKKHLGVNPACSAEFFVQKAFEQSKEDPLELINVALDAKTCIGNLRDIAAITAASGPAAPVVLSAAAVIKGLETINACANVAVWLANSGIIENVQCFLQPKVSTPKYEECRCDYKCTVEGVLQAPPNPTPRSRMISVKYKYGYITQGACKCTNDKSVAGE